MRLLQATILALLSASVVVGALLLVSFVSPYAWIPLTYAAVLGGWLSLLPFVRDQDLSFWVFFGLAIAVLVVWVLSEGALAASLAGSKTKIAPWEGWLMVGADLVLLAGTLVSRARKQPIGWLILLLMLCVLVVQTSNAGAGAGRMVHWLMAHLGWDQPRAEHLVVIVRKTIHISFYGFLAYTGWRAAGQAQLRKPALLGFAAGAALIVASFDELRQTTQIGRGGSIWDVLLDMCGAGAALLLVGRLTAKGPSKAAPKGAQ